MTEKPLGCARPSGSVVGASPPEDTAQSPEAAPPQTRKDAPMSQIMVGRPAPDFTAPAYHKGAFTQVKLSDNLGKWVVLCFYPGDFTFV